MKKGGKKKPKTDTKDSKRDTTQTRESDDESPVKKPTKVLTSEEFIAEKRKTEKGNTYFLKAKEAVDQDEIRIKQAFMNPQ